LPLILDRLSINKIILKDFTNIQVELLILYPYLGVPQTVHIF